MARPNRLNYATGPAGKKRFVEALRKWQDKQKALKEKAAAKKPAPKKPVVKKPVAEKPATKTKTRTRTQTKSKSTTTSTSKSKTKTTPTTKSKTKTTPTTKSKTKTTPKRKPFDAQKRGPGRPKGSTKTTVNNAPKTNQTLKIAGDGAKRTGRFLKNTAKQAYDLGKKGVNKLQTKLSAKDQTPQQANPEPKTKAQKLMSRINKSYQAYKGQVLDKAGKDLSKKGKLRSGLSDKSLKAQSRGGTRASLAAGALTVGTNALVNRAFKPKNMTMAEFKAAKEKSNREGVRKAGLRIKKLAGNVVNKVRGKGNNNQSSTTKNINKQKKANTTPNRGLKIKKTERSSRKNTNKDYNAPTATKKADKRFSTFRVDADENLKLQKERQKGNTETYSRKLSTQAQKTKSNKTTTTKAPRPGSARARLRAKNVERFGKAHVDRLVAKNKEFQSIKRIKNREERKKKREAYRQKYGK